MFCKTPPSTKLRLTRDLDEIDTLWAGIEAHLNGYFVDPRERFQINLVVDELFTNIVTHAFEDDGDYPIDATIAIDKRQLFIVLEDGGIPFNPLEFDSPDFEKPLSERAEGGLGVHLCKMLLPKLSYERIEDKNRVIIKKRVRKYGLISKLMAGFCCYRRHNGN